MSQYKVVFYFENEDTIEHLVEASSKQDALGRIEIGGNVYDFENTRGDLVRIFVDKVNYIKVLEYTQTSVQMQNL